MHIPVKQLHIVERRLFQDPQFDTALWPRTRRVLEYALRIECNDLYRGWHIEVCESDHTHKDALDRMVIGIDSANGQLPLLITRFKGTTSSYIYSVWLPEQLDRLSPPFSVLVASGPNNRHWVVLQETTIFLGRLGLGIVFDEVLEHEES